MVSGGALCGLGPQLVADTSKVFDETPVFMLLFCWVRMPENG
jgi:hypothetical protein